MAEKYTIRRMKENEVQIAIDWAAKEGWNPGLDDAECFYKADPNGFFVGLLDGEPIATGCAIVYDDNFAFCGLYIVKPEYRAQRFGLQLTHDRLHYVGNRITGLDGVLDKVSKYERLGYKFAYKNARFMLPSTTSFSKYDPIVEVKSIPFSQLEAFDRLFFPAPRKAFLQKWITQKNGFALGYVDGQLRGYGVIRKCLEGYKVGPLFAETSAIAQALFESLCSKVASGPIYWDVPEVNKEANDLVRQYKMKSVFEVIRMYRNGIPQVNLAGIYGITTYELG